MNIESLSNWNPFKVKAMFPTLQLSENELESYKKEYVSEKKGFESFYDYLKDKAKSN